MKLRTEYDPKPIPIREFDWSAIDDDTYDVGGLIGWGATEAVDWNDAPERTHAEVMDAFDRAIAAAGAE